MSNGNGVTATLSQAADSVKETAGNIGSTIATTAGEAAATVRTSATRVRKAAISARLETTEAEAQRAVS